MDLDHFKQVNDQNGHATGDSVLRAVALACQSRLRMTDLMGRIGGEEFAIVLPGTNVNDAAGVAEDLRASIARLPVLGAAGKIQISASFGIAGLNSCVAVFDELLEAADKALYVAKEDGRNRCSVWAQPAPLPLSPSVRRRVLKAGRIAFNTGRSTVDCTVRSLSDGSAGIEVFSSAGIPQLFKLYIESDNFARACRTVSRTDKHLEVEFVEAKIIAA